MALYHLTVTQVKRSKGQSSVASAAYISGEKLRDDYYGKTYDYTKKKGVLFSDILLPDYAPERLKDRATLWNEVESIERNKKAQLCYNFNFALQNELSYEENKAVAERFIRENFLARGMIVDYAIHDPDKKGKIQNPHVHMLIPIRPLNKDGTWGQKQMREYLYDDYGGPILDNHGRHKFNAVPTTDWGNPETLQSWRKAYADIFNEAFEKKGLPCRIDNRSNKERGLDSIPTIHEGPHVRAMEEKGIRTEVGDRNRKVRIANEFIKKLAAGLMDIIEWFAEFIKRCNEEKIYMPALYQLVFDYYDKRYASAYSAKGKSMVLKTRMEVCNFLMQTKIKSFEELADYVRDAYQKVDDAEKFIRKIDVRIHCINEVFRYKIMYAENKPYFTKSESFTFKFQREKYKKEHSDELNKYHMAKRKINDFWKDKEHDWSALNKEIEQLKEKKAKKERICKEYSKTASNAYRIKSIAEEMMKDFDAKELVYVPKKTKTYDMEL